MRNNLLVSVITPSFNSAQYIERAIQSVSEQDYPHWEHIIMDGGSTDGTVEILKKYPHLNWISALDQGQADAMNKGFARAKGDIIVYLNADDYFFPGAFSAIMPAFAAGASFVVGNVLVKSPRLNAEFLNTPRITFEGMLRHWEPNAFCHNPVGYFYRREIQEACPFNLNNHATMDLEFLLDAAARFPFTKVEYTLGCFEDGLNTKTHDTQVRYDYWQADSFPYLDRHIAKLPLLEREKYLADRRAGYVRQQAESNQRAKREYAALAPSDVDAGISVIIPAYNCRDFICRAVDSVLAQNIDDLEILVINDASPDDVEFVVRERYGVDARVRVIRHAENKKQGAARNTGLEQAVKEYVFFLDSDDWLEEDALRTLRGIAAHSRADIVAGGVQKAWADGTISPYHAHAFACTGGREALWYLAEYYVGSLVWNKMYRRRFLMKNSLRFLEKYWHEDVIFSMKAIALCNRYISIDDVCVNYFQNDASTTRGKPTPLHLSSYIRMWLDIDNFAEEFDLKNDGDGISIFKLLLKNHASADMVPKIKRYIELTLAEDIDMHIESACKDVFGTHGIAFAEALSSLLASTKESAANEANCAPPANTIPSLKEKLKARLAGTVLYAPCKYIYSRAKNWHK
jgi:Glycosyltransferases involved in cell wall biogenesis